MELNIAPVTTTNPSLRAPTSKKAKVKGSWRKRRREEVIQRIQVQKRQRPSNRVQQKSKALQLQADEFASGIAKETAPEPVAAVPSGRTAQGNKNKARKDAPLASTRLEKLPNIGVAGKKRKDAVKDDDTAPPEEKASSHSVKSHVVDKPDQRPEAVSATLAVVGGSSSLHAHGAERTNGKGGDANSSNQKADQHQTDTFGASSFEATGLYRSVARHVVNRMGLEVPTLIQEKVLEAMLSLSEGQQTIDLLVRSATGSGKTLAYLLPIAHYLLNRARRTTREDGTLGVIIVPTRELADQVEEVAESLFRPWHWIVVGCIRGGESKHKEKARLRKGISVLVATPGRLLDHMRNTRSFTYGFCEFLVLDEADRLLDLGFEAEIKEIIENLDNQAKLVNPNTSSVRSNVLLSATLSGDVEKLAEFSLRDPVEVTVGQSQENKASFAMPLQLRQHYSIVEQRYRLVTLACFLRLRALKEVSSRAEGGGKARDSFCKIIVFFSTCDSVDFHYELLSKATLPRELKNTKNDSDSVEKLLPLEVLRIHGNHSQADRVRALRNFRKSNRAVLFCTDVAARGLDLKGLTFAVQYDPPTGGQGEELEYLHRAGRTARIGAQGDALLFLLPSERAYVGRLQAKGISITEISGSAAIAALYPRADLSKQESISYATRLVTSAVQESFENILQENSELKGQAVAGFQAYCRAYATHAREVRYFFHVRNLHLGHVARAFVLGDKPAELSQMMAELKAAREASEAREQEPQRKNHETRKKGDIARAIAEGENQPYNDQRSELARRRREKGRGLESFKELAMEFGA